MAIAIETPLAKWLATHGDWTTRLPILLTTVVIGFAFPNRVIGQDQSLQLPRVLRKSQIAEGTAKHVVDETSAAVSSSGNLSNGPISQENTPRTDEMDPAILAEIKQIRAQLGGGVARQLEGVLELPPLPRVNGAPNLHGMPNRDLNLTPKQLMDEAFDNEIKQLAGLAAAPAKGAKVYVPHVNALRNAAKHLDMAAAELEEVSEYVMADQLRNQAQQLRIRARSAPAER